jgi:hypothetical protein
MSHFYPAVTQEPRVLGVISELKSYGIGPDRVVKVDVNSAFPRYITFTFQRLTRKMGKKKVLVW